VELAGRIVLVVLGVLIVVATIGSAVKTVVLPRAAVSQITRAVFLAVRRIFWVVARPSLPFERRDRILALYAPLSLLATLATWLVLVLLGYTLIFWGVDGTTYLDAFDLSGSSLLTLGITRPPSEVSTVLVFTEAALGLFLLALMITYLPSLYSAFSRREQEVTALEVRAGSPPSGRELIWRYWVLERPHALTDVWQAWERWFVDIEESHSSFPAVVFFRSPQPDHSWITSAGAVLDGAALAVSSVDIPRDVQAEICIRAGYLALRRIADSFQIPYDPNPEPDDPISITRDEWEEALDALATDGVALKPDRDQAWRDFAGWRVNYDTVLLALCNLTSAPYAPWSSDRSGTSTVRPRLFHRDAISRTTG
jgi:hypothetical protein